jgi:hypothetical protein
MGLKLSFKDLKSMELESVNSHNFACFNSKNSKHFLTTVGLE